MGYGPAPFGLASTPERKHHPGKWKRYSANSQQKGKKIVHVPVHPIVKAILNSYGDNPPKVITNQKFNEALKEIAGAAELGKISISGSIVETLNRDNLSDASVTTSTPLAKNPYTKSLLYDVSISQIPPFQHRLTKISFKLKITIQYFLLHQ